MQEFPILYKKAKTEAVQEWKIWAENGTIYTEWGQQGGAKQIATEHCSGKNIGRSNETTPQSQAESQALSKWKKQKDRGYRESLDDIEERVILPMLANNKAIKRGDQVKFQFPVDIQPKLDGVRCLAFWENGKIVLLSRKGKPYNIPHIVKELQGILPEGWVFDGEIYIHGAGLQTLNRLVRPLSPPEGQDQVEYRIYDIPVKNGAYDFTWKNRRKSLDELSEVVDDESIKKIHVVPTWTIYTLDELWKMHDLFISQGYEGAIVRLHHLPYEFNHRSSKLFKVKDFDEGEFEVVGYEGGTPGTKEEFAVKWICKTEDGKVFRVRPKGTIEDREEDMQTAEAQIGKMLTVKWQTGQLTEDGCPKFATSVGFKEDR